MAVTVLPRVEVLLVGLGAAGGIAAHVLTEAGLKVTALEAGEEKTREHFIKQMDELSGSTMRNAMGDALVNRTVPTWRKNAQSPAGDPVNKYPTMNGVGGTSVHYGGASWRLCEGDFAIRSQTERRYGKAALPPGSTLADWPLGYADLEPYYDKVEHAIGVCGDNSGNPWEAPRSRPFPMPPLADKGWTRFAADKLKAMGYHPFHQPAAVNSVPYGGREACSYCGYCSGFGCWNDSKGSTLVTTIPVAKKTGRLDVRTRCRVTRILSDEQGRVTGVRYVDADGQEVEQPARFVILSMFVYETVRRLLLSKSARFPQGLANNHGQVGKHFLTHTYVIVNGLYDMDVRAMSGLGAQATAIDDFYGDNFDHQGLGFIRGASVLTFSEARPIGAAAARPPGVPAWGPAYKAWLKDGLRKVCAFYGQMEVMPYDANFLDLDPAKRDEWGDPLLRVTYDMYDNEARMGAFLEARMGAMHQALGARQVWTATRAQPTPWTSHVYGGARMGTDPAASVVDQHGLAHEVQGLAIMGGAQFPNSGGRNPTETIQALAWRSAEHIAKNFQTLAGPA